MLRIACFLIFCAQMTFSQTVTVARGDVQITGDILGFDGHYLRLQTEHGEVTLDYSKTNCVGECPNLDNFVPFMRFSGAQRLSDVLVPSLIEGYARSRPLKALRRDIDATHFEYDVVDRESGEPRLRMSFHVTDSSVGIHDLIEQRTDIALSLRELNDEERKQAEAEGLGDLSDPRRAEIVALDALVPVGSKGWKSDQILRQRLEEIFFSAEDVPVKRFAFGDATGLAFAYLGTHADHLDESYTDMGRFSLAFEGAEVALGLGNVNAADFDRALAISGPCGISTAADRVSIKTEDYPLTRPLFLYRAARRLAPDAEAWLDWLRSEEAQQIVKRAGFVDRSFDRLPLNDQGDRLARAIEIAGGEVALEQVQEMVERLSVRDRLTTTFRFRPGATRLNAQSRSNLYRLAVAIREGVFDGTRLALIGFSDGKGPAEANRTLSFARAETVRKALVDTLGGSLPSTVSVEVDAFGEMLPLACDDVEWGRQSNRRVELWIER